VIKQFKFGSVLVKGLSRSQIESEIGFRNSYLGVERKVIIYEAYTEIISGVRKI
jgi:DUF917 family protein